MSEGLQSVAHDFPSTYRLQPVVVQLLPIEKGDVRTIVNSGTYLGFPDVSPDGRMIAYVNESSGVPAIWISDISGANARQLTRSELPEDTPIFSGDGTSIAFVRRTSLVDPNLLDAELFVIDISGKSEKRLTDDRFVDSPVRFSRDGTELYFVSERSMQGLKTADMVAQLFKISLADLSISPVLQLDLRSAAGCDLSMDEKTVVFVEDPKKNFAYDVFTCNVDGSARQQRTTLGSYIGSVRFGFHSDRFTFIEGQLHGSQGNVYVYDLNTSSMQKVELP